MRFYLDAFAASALCTAVGLIELATFGTNWRWIITAALAFVIVIYAEMIRGGIEDNEKELKQATNR